MHAIEEQLVKEQEMLRAIRAYVEGDALSEELHAVEKGLHQKLLDLGRLLLEEVVLRHGERDVGETCTHGGVVRQRYSEGKRAYLSIFGTIAIKRAYYWDKDKGGYYPLDAALRTSRNCLACNYPNGRMSRSPMRRAGRSCRSMRTAKRRPWRPKAALSACRPMAKACAWSGPTSPSKGRTKAVPGATRARNPGCGAWR